MPTSSHIPPEIIEQVVGYLRANTKALKSCSLVSSQWLPSAWTILFQQLTLDSTSHRRFFDLIQSKSIPPCVLYCRRLRLKQASWLFNIDGERLREVTVHLSAIAHLSIIDTTVPSFQHLVQAILQFPALRSLKFEELRFENNPRNVPTLPTSPLLGNIDTLVVWGTIAKDLFVPINSSKIFGNVTKLFIDGVREADFVHFGGYVSRHAANILEFAIRYGCHYDPNSFQICGHDTVPSNPLQVLYTKSYGLQPSPTLNRLCNLQKLRIDNYLDHRLEAQSTALYWAPRMLISLFSYSLRTVVLSIYLSHSAQLDKYSINWVFLDEIFSSEGYRNVVDVTFECTGTASIESVHNLLEMRLPGLTQRGLLRVQSPVGGGWYHT